MQNNTHIAIDRLITRITGIVAGILLCILIGWGVVSLYQGIKYEQTNDAQIQESINPLISATGGFIVKVNFQENQYLKKGDTLFVIDNRESTLLQEQVEAALLNSRTQLVLLECSIKSLKIASLVNKAEMKVAGISDIETRQHILLAAIEKLQAMLKRDKPNLSYTVIRAPYNCRIGKRNIEEGQMIERGQILGYLVNKEAGKWVIANYKETQVNNIHVGEMARIDADAFPGKKFAGRVLSLSPATGSSFSLLPPDNSTGNFVKIVQRIPVRIQITGSAAENVGLEAGMSVTVTLVKDK